MTTPTRVLIVGCGARKLPHPAPAADLYTGPLFRAARAYADAQGAPWWVVSARHGLVRPDRVLAPYDQRLRPSRADSFGTWPLSLHLHHLVRAMGPLVVEVHAGRPYVEAVRMAASMQEDDCAVLDPLQGLQVGQRLAWYAQRRGRP